MTADIEQLQAQVTTGILEHKVAEEVALIEVTERVDGLQAALTRHVSVTGTAVRQNAEELRGALSELATRWSLRCRGCSSRIAGVDVAGRAGEWGQGGQ